MYSRKTTMTRLINRLIERTVSLVSARRAPPMGPMQTMLTSPLGQAGIRPLPALAAKPLADAQERRGAMRISEVDCATHPHPRSRVARRVRHIATVTLVALTSAAFAFAQEDNNFVPPNPAPPRSVPANGWPLGAASDAGNQLRK